MTKTQTPASDKQINFIEKLLSERDRSNEQDKATCETIEMLLKNGDLTGGRNGSASGAIDMLFKIPKDFGPKKEVAITEPGIYRHDGEFFRVRWNGPKTRLYGERVVGSEGHAHFVYAKGIVFDLTPEDLLTWEDARDFGKAFSVCINCAKTLSTDQSIVQGYGPTCAKNNGWPTVTDAEAKDIMLGLLEPVSAWLIVGW